MSILILSIDFHLPTRGISYALEACLWQFSCFLCVSIFSAYLLFLVCRPFSTIVSPIKLFMCHAHGVWPFHLLTKPLLDDSSSFDLMYKSQDRPSSLPIASSYAMSFGLLSDIRKIEMVIYVRLYAYSKEIIGLISPLKNSQKYYAHDHLCGSLKMRVWQN